MNPGTLEEGNAIAETDHSASLREGEGDGPGRTADESATSNKTSHSHGNPSISNDMASAVPLCNGTISIKVEQPDDASRVTAEPSPVNLRQSSNTSSCGYHQGQVIESGFQSEMKPVLSAHQQPHMNMYGCSQSSQEEDDGVWYPGCNANGGIQNHTTPWGLGHQPVTSHSFGTNSSVALQGISIKVEQSDASQVPVGSSQVHHDPQTRHFRGTHQGQQLELGFQDEMKPQVCLAQPPETYTLQRSQEPQMSTNAAGVKRKYRRMGALDCVAHAQTEQGSMALKNPATIRTSSKDVNRGLYPWPPKPSQRGVSLPTNFSPKKQKRSPQKFQLSPEEMKNQSRIDTFFHVSPRKKAVTDNSLDKRKVHPSPEPAAVPSSFYATHTSSSLFMPKKNLNSQFASMGPAKSPEGQVFSRNTTTSNSYQAGTAASPENNVQMTPSHPSCQVWTPRTPTKVYPNQNHAEFSHTGDQSSLSTHRHRPVKSVDTCRDGVSESFLSTPRPSTSRFVQPLLPSSQEGTPNKPKQSPSPPKSEISTVENDIDNFNNDTSLDDFGPTIMPMTSSQGTGSTVDTCRDGVSESSLGTSRPSTSSFAQPSLLSSQEGTLTKPKQSPSPAKSKISTVESDIDDFNNDTSLDDFGSTIMPMASSQGTSSTVDSDIEAFDNDSYFDNTDPEMLSVESPSVPLLSDNNPPNTFGLLGEGSSPGCSYSDDEPLVHGFDRLPIEVLQRIFCFVPMMDLCQHLSCVCKLWHQIISKEEFMPWKKAYHRVRTKAEIDVTYKLNLTTHNAQSETEATCLLWLVRNMPKFKARCGPSMDKDLQKHPKYDLAKDIMKDRAPELLQNEQPNTWSTISLLVILSETVQDVSAILKCLLHPTATCTTMEVLECMYCIAAHLWKYKRVFGLSSGWHYRVYYTLYLFENSQSSVCLVPVTPNDNGAIGGCRSRQKQRMPATHEQFRIINHDIQIGKVIKIEAFAGTGKTSTLVKYAERRPNMSFLYVAFNKSVMHLAEEIFPSNVSSRTTHSLAYKVIGWRYKMKLVSSLKPFSINKVLPTRKEPKGTKKLHWLRYANLVCKTLDSFCASADDYITTSHVPVGYFEYIQGMEGITAVRHDLDHSQRMKIGNDASSVWKKMIDPKNMDAKITHDVYLKLYQLSKPRNLQYDCLLIDEAQDLTPAQQDIFLNQRGSKILVGDQHQQIYSFRGATNAMNRVVAEHTFHLTQSFRFGPGIAYIADCLLERSSRKVRHTLVGKMVQDHIDGEEIGQLAIITRTNLTLFREAVRIVETDTTTMIAFAGGIEGYGMDVILDIYQLQLPEKERGFIENKHILYHKNFGELKEYANRTEDGELLSKIKIVEQYNIRIPELIKLIQSRTRRESTSGIVLSTVHKSKGLEFDTVKITDDFAISNARSPLNIVSGDELNMVYVAVTRAKKSLVLTHSLVNFICAQPSLEKFAYPVSAKSSSGQGANVCIECQATIPDTAIVLLKRTDFKVAYPSGTRHRSGILCHQCSRETYPSFECFLHVYGEDPLPSQEYIPNNNR